MKPLIKICGITNEDDALFCAEAGVHFLGFIFYKKSPRYIKPTQAAEIIKKLPSTVTPVGVFVNEERKRIEEFIRESGIRLLQLSGDELPEDCTGFDADVWKAFRVHDMNEVKRVTSYKISAGLLDGARGDLYGGSGMLADFAIARAIKKIHRLVLAGGLNPDNVLDAVEEVQPYAIDVNSGVEESPGKKDHSKLTLLFDKLTTLI